MFPKHFETDLKWFSGVAEDFHRAARLWKQLFSVSPVSATNVATTDRKSDEWPCCLPLPTSLIQFRSFVRKLANNRRVEQFSNSSCVFFFSGNLLAALSARIWSAHLSSLVTTGADSRGPLFVTYVRGLKLVSRDLWGCCAHAASRTQTHN